MEQVGKGSLAEFAARETWTVEDREELLGRLFEMHNAPDKLKNMLGKMEAENPDPKGGAALKIGMARCMLCRFGDALEALNGATDNKDRRYIQATCFMGLRQYDRAIEELDRAKARGWEADDIDLKMAEAQALAGDLAAAEKAVDRLHKRLNETAAFHYVRGLVDELNGYGERAVASYEHARQLDPHCAEATFRLAYYYDLHGEEAAAIQLYQECLSLPPVRANALLNLAVLYEDAGEYDKAIYTVRRVLASNPNHARAKLILQDCQAAKVMYYDEEQAKRMAYRSAVLDIPVTDFELSVRARNCLKKMNIRSLGDLVRTTEVTLMNYKNFGETSLREIKEMLSVKGLTLGQALEEGEILLAGVPMMPVRAPSGGVSEEVLATSLVQIDFSIRVRRALEAMKLKTLGDLAAKTEGELLSCNNFGQTSLNEVHAKLAEYGLKLSEGS